MGIPKEELEELQRLNNRQLVAHIIAFIIMFGSVFAGIFLTLYLGPESPGDATWLVVALLGLPGFCVGTVIIVSYRKPTEKKARDLIIANRNGKFKVSGKNKRTENNVVERLDINPVDIARAQLATDKIIGNKKNKKMKQLIPNECIECGQYLPGTFKKWCKYCGSAICSDKCLQVHESKEKFLVEPLEKTEPFDNPLIPNPDRSNNRCGYCGGILNPHGNFNVRCEYCGKWFCSKECWDGHFLKCSGCGAINRCNWRFCGKCGNELTIW